MRVKRQSRVRPVRNPADHPKSKEFNSRVKLTVGFIFRDQSALKKAQVELEKHFGDTDLESPIIAFTHTDYYQKEFGRGLKRKFISFSRLIAPDRLAGIKVFTNGIERKLTKRSCRLVNIDPGYVDMAKLVLATTKDYNHRIYLNKGIFAEITLSFQNGSFTPWDWTYPDYRSADYIAIFNRIRQAYADQVKDKR